MGFKNLKISFHDATKDEVEIHNIKLPIKSTVAIVIHELKKKVELSHPNAELRLLEVAHHKIFRIFPHNKEIQYINDQYWTLRAEEIPEEEKNLGPHDQLIRVYHFTKESAAHVRNFGQPFLFVIHEGETLREVKVRIQKRLKVPDEEFSKWKFAFLSLGCPEYLQDSDVVPASFQCLGLEHSDKALEHSWAANKIVTKTLLAEPSSTSRAETSHPNLVSSPETLQKQREALQHYFTLSLEAIEEPNGFDEIERIALFIIQHSSNSFERTILKDLVPRLATFKGIVPETRSIIQNVRAQRKILHEKNMNLGTILDEGQEKVASLKAEREKLSAEVVEVEAEVKRLTLLKDELLAGKVSVDLELDKIKEQVSKDLEERRKLDNETEQVDKIWLQAREKLAQANLSWKLYDQNLQLCKDLV